MTVLTTVLAIGLLGGCAQPGQLGHEQPEPAVEPAPVAPAALPPAPRAPAPGGLLSSGLVEDRVSMRSTGPAEFSVETVVLAPGESQPWHRHPGTELSLVRSGEVTVQRGEGCEPARYSAGDGVFVGDGEPHVVRNEGPVPAELVVTQLLAPGAPDDEPVEPVC